MTTIKDQQNTVANLRLLAAQRQLYSQAKVFQRLHLLGALILQVAAPVVLIVAPHLDVAMACIGGAGFLLSWLLLDRAQDQKVRRAATIQEQFDVAVFGLPWNSTLVGDRILPELVNAAAAGFKGNTDDLKDWYPDLDALAYPLNVVHAQRANLVWDSRLRRDYAGGMSIITAILFAVGIAVSVATDQSLRTYLLAVLLPSLAALREGWQLATSHRSIADEHERVERGVRQYAKEGGQSPTVEDCRRIQDTIYLNRRRGPLVPDSWYRWRESRFEMDMQATAAELSGDSPTT
jgi:SMODS-associating 4TM effector domain